MKLSIQVKTKSKTEYVRKVDETHYVIAVHEPPVHGKANQVVLKSLARYFGIPKSRIYIVGGEKSKQKTVEVPIADNRY